MTRSLVHDVCEQRLRERRPRHLLHSDTLAGLDLEFKRPGTAPLTEPRLQVDGSQPLDVNLPLALEYVGHGQG